MDDEDLALKDNDTKAKPSQAPAHLSKAADDKNKKA